MPIVRRQIVALGSVGLAACAAPGAFRDGSTVPSDRALVLVHPRYSFGRLDLNEIEIGLTRLEAGKPAENLVLSLVPNKQVSVLAVEPGFYFLRRLQALGGYYRHTFEPRITLFVARPGQVNYPGDWIIEVSVVSSSVSGTVARGAFSAEYQIEVATVENGAVASMLASKYPELNAKLPLKVTRATDQ